MSKLSRFILQVVVVGIAAAVVILLIQPEGLNGKLPVVEVRQAPVIERPPANGPVSYADAVDQAAPAVVNIFTARTVVERTPLQSDPFFGQFQERGETLRRRTQTSLGSGVILSAQGYLLTNNHVIAGAEAIAVLLADGRSFEASVVGTDPDTDLAVLKIAARDDLPTLTVGRSSELRVGDVVLAIGNPFGVGQTVTQGIVSATGRHSLGINTYEDFIQTDAAINPGNSGGALVNAHGDLVAINTAIFSQSGGSHGIGFAIPVDLARDVMTQIIEHGEVIRGWLGVEAQDVTPQLAESFGLPDTRGVLIAGIYPDGPADRAGMRPGDVIIEVDGEVIEQAYEALNLIALAQPGETVTITLWRDGRRVEAETTVAKRPTARAD
ncbi:MAG: Do family serine endopeptidase [Gammaproteobacteria bacterium]|nr:Do family serine endopeptidase [Gammaproteobacteria bacterium]MDX5375724.1 Do family serine endopeptidase [Gammaproteobacteria bacterium]